MKMRTSDHTSRLALLGCTFLACTLLPQVVGCPPPDGVDPCEGVTCDAGETCEDGVCVPDMADPCEGMTCDEDEVCVDGECVVGTACDMNTDCPDGQSCVNGVCMVTMEARNFAGAATCMPCHPNQHSPWSETLHAGAWETLVNSGEMQDFCIRCHVVGYQVGGFVDEATTPEFTGVQCENCHGAAGDHAANPGDLSLRPPVDVSADVCGQCHTGSHHPNFEQWGESRHSQINEVVEEDLLAGGFFTNSCGICHSGDVHIESVVFGEEVPEDRFVELSGGDLNAITCAVCHNPHTQTGNAAMPEAGRDYQLRYPQVANPTPTNNTDEIVDPTRYNICGQCHHSRGRAWDATSRGPHHSVQANIYIGEMPIPDGTEVLVENTASIHRFTPEQCATCHLFRKDFESEQAPAISGHFFSVNLESCLPCHPSGAEELQTDLGNEVQARLDDIRSRLGDPATWQYTADGGPPAADDAGPGQMSQEDISDEIKQVRFIWSYINGDGSLGTHNPAYVRAMLDGADALLDTAGL